MKVIVGFEELSGEIKGRFNQEVTFEHVSDTEVKVTYRKKVMLVSVPVSVNLTVADVSGESVSLRYHMMAGVDQLISWVLKSVSGRIPELKDALRIDGEGRQVFHREFHDTRYPVYGKGHRGRPLFPSQPGLPCRDKADA